MTGEELKIVRQEIRKQLGIILYGSAGTNTQQTETIEKMYPGQPNITDRPVMHPYGVSSRAPSGTLSMVGKVGEHIGNRVVLGHMDRNREDPGSGGVILYDSHGHKIQLREEGMEFEANGVKLIDELIKLLEELIKANVITAIGPQPFLSTHITVFDEIRQQLESIRGSL